MARVGVVGLEPGSRWAARAHVPALRALSDSYEIVGVANTSLASAPRAAAKLGLPRAFSDVAELVSAPEVDIVTVTRLGNFRSWIDTESIRKDGRKGM